MRYFSAYGIFLLKEVASIKKGTWEHPIYEAFSNSWESLKSRFGDNISNGEISISLYLAKELIKEGANQKYIFEKMVISDNGLGLENEGFDRLITLRDNRKGSKNQGTGRVQYLHFFDKTIIESVNKDPGSSTGWVKRTLTLSKSEEFLAQNAILREDSVEDVPSPNEPSFSVSFLSPLYKPDEKRYSEVNLEVLKKVIIRRFLALFCENREYLPRILIRLCVDGVIVDQVGITQIDVPKANSSREINVPYSMLENEKIVQISRSEKFALKTFVLPKGEIEKNGVFLVSKGETSFADTLSLDCLNPKDDIAGNRYLFLLSGEYIDQNDTDVRGQIKLMTKAQFKRDRDLFSPRETILLEDLKSEVNHSIQSAYPEISATKKEKGQSLEDLQRMFLLNPKTVDAIRDKISTTDSDEEILKRIYESEAEIEARQDAEIKQQVAEICALNPTDEDYQRRLKEKANEFVRSIPQKNRTALSQYVARRKLVLDIFGKILSGELEKLGGQDRVDEDILHNLIFQQSSTSPEDSDLWLINEEYIYFKGASERRLIDLEYQGKKIFDRAFQDEELRYLNSLGERRLSRRPDVLLFPEEGKCIILEFKAPDVNVSDYLMQIDFYASLIRNYTREELNIVSFYGYLIGESIEDRDVRGRVSRFELSPKFGFWFRPSERVTGFSGRSDGNIYTEVLKYSSLLERAKLRNKIFIEKLEKGNR